MYQYYLFHSIFTSDFDTKILQNFRKISARRAHKKLRELGQRGVANLRTSLQLF